MRGSTEFALTSASQKRLRTGDCGRDIHARPAPLASPRLSRWQQRLQRNWQASCSRAILSRTTNISSVECEQATARALILRSAVSRRPCLCSCCRRWRRATRGSETCRSPASACFPFLEIENGVSVLLIYFARQEICCILMIALRPSSRSQAVRHMRAAASEGRAWHE